MIIYDCITFTDSLYLEAKIFTEYLNDFQMILPSLTNPMYYFTDYNFQETTDILWQTAFNKCII